jgi:hypothetical protein
LYNKCIVLELYNTCKVLELYNKCIVLGLYNKCIVLELYNTCIVLELYNKCIILELYNKWFELIDLIFCVLTPLSTIFQLLSWRPVLVVEEAGETMGKQLVNFITCGCESSAPFL